MRFSPVTKRSRHLRYSPTIVSTEFVESRSASIAATCVNSAAHVKRVQYQQIHRVDYRYRCHGISQPPAGHGKTLRKSVDDYGALRHAGQRSNGLVLAAEQNARVNFVRKNPQVVLCRKLRDFLERRLAENRSCRIIR